MLTNGTCNTNESVLTETASQHWKALIERLAVFACIVISGNLIFSYCGGLFGIVEFLLASADSAFFAIEVIFALSFTWVLLFHPHLIERCLQLFNPVPAYRAGILAYLSRLTMPTPAVRSVPQSAHGCRAPPSFFF